HGQKGYDRVSRQSDPRAPDRLLRRGICRPHHGAVVWTNHHHLMRYATEVRPRLIWALVHPTSHDDVSRRVRRIMRVRSVATLCLFGLAALVALTYPRVGLGICCCCLIGYLRPEAPGAMGSESIESKRVRVDGISFDSDPIASLVMLP